MVFVGPNMGGGVGVVCVNVKPVLRSTSNSPDLSLGVPPLVTQGYLDQQPQLQGPRDRIAVGRCAIPWAQRIERGYAAPD